MPSCFLMTFSSDLCTSPSWRKLRLRLGLFFSRMWRLKALARLILPVPVSLTRFAVPLCVLTLGICSLLFLRGRDLGAGLVRVISLRRLSLDYFLLRGRDQHEHVATLEFRLAFDERELRDLALELLQDGQAALGMHHLTTAEHDGHLDLRAALKEAHDMLLLGLVVVDVDLRTKLDLLDLNPRLVLSGLLGLLLQLVLVLAIVHDLADRRVSVRRDLHE